MESGTAAVPDFVVTLFRDGTDCVLLRAYPYWSLLRFWWAQWKAERPGAVPPRGFAWIDTPAPATLDGQPYAEAVADALAAARRGEAWAAKQRARA